MAFNVFSGEWVGAQPDIALPPTPMKAGSVVAPLMTPTGSAILCAKFNPLNPATPSVWKVPAMGEHPCPYADGDELASVAYGGCSIDSLGKNGMDTTSNEGFITAFGSVRLLNTWAKRANIDFSFDGFGEGALRVVAARVGVYVRRHYREQLMNGGWGWEQLANVQLGDFDSGGATSASIGLWYRCVLWFSVYAEGQPVNGQRVDGSVSLSVSYSG